MESETVAPARRRPPALLAVVGVFVGILSFGVYAWTSARTLISCGDSAELTAVAATFGVAHAPGYPLFTVLGGLFCAFVPGSPAFGVNLFTALCSALATVSMFFLLARITGQWAPAAAGSLTLAFSYHFWLYAHVPEFSALNALFIGLLLISAIRRRYYLAAFLAGLALAHHHSILFLFPGLILLFVDDLKSFTRSQWARLGLCVILGLLPYVYVPWRAHAMPALNAGTVTDLSRFMDHFLRRAYGVTSLTPEFAPFNGAALDSSLAFYGESLVRSFSWVGVGIGVLGFFVLLWRSPKLFAALGSAAVLAGPFFVAWAGMPATSAIFKTILERFFVASFFLFAVGIGVGLARIIEKVKGAPAAKLFPRLTAGLAAGALFLLPASLWIQNGRSLNLSSFNLCETYGRDLMESFPSNAVVVVNGDNSLFTLWYLQGPGQHRPDLKIINSSMSPAYSDHLRHHFPELEIPSSVTPSLRDMLAHWQGRFPLYVVGIPGTEFKELGLMGNPFYLRPHGLAFEVVREPGPDPVPLSTMKMEFNFDFPRAWRNHWFVEELVSLYTIGYYNQAVIHATRKEGQAAWTAVNKALEVDPSFEPARAMKERFIKNARI